MYQYVGGMEDQVLGGRSPQGISNGNLMYDVSMYHQFLCESYIEISTHLIFPTNVYFNGMNLDE